MRVYTGLGWGGCAAACGCAVMLGWMYGYAWVQACGCVGVRLCGGVAEASVQLWVGGCAWRMLYVGLWLCSEVCGSGSAAVGDAWLCVGIV